LQPYHESGIGHGVFDTNGAEAFATATDRAVIDTLVRKEAIP